MTNGNESAYPSFGAFVPEPTPGLTKREYFAAMAMPIFSTDEDAALRLAEDSNAVNYELMAECCMRYADALIEALNK